MKLRAIENMHEAGIEIMLVITIVNNVNNDQVGPIVKFAMENPKKIAFVSFQPVSFTGRDEDITPERRLRQRYTLSHLAKDVSEQVGKIEPTRDWFPLSFISPFAGFADMVHGTDAQWGALSCGCYRDFYCRLLRSVSYCSFSSQERFLPDSNFTFYNMQVWHEVYS